MIHAPHIRALLLCALLLSVTAAAADPGGLRRFAVVAGNDEGGDGTRPLLYAREDAEKIHDILTRLGGVRPEDAELVLNGDAEDFLKALATVERKSQQARATGQKTALFIYYSGHAKDGALRLGDSRVPFEALKSRLSQAPADVRVGIFDACQSGAMTRAKGARKAPAFEIQATAAQDAKGMVILTSSSADEDSQESDQLGGSYFSHHLATALLGGADRSGDGRVSLSEAYAYAYERTVADTSSSTAGAQHPTYSYDFQGNGDLVLTDLVDRREGLVFPATAPGGTYYVVDGRGFVVAEVAKADGDERRIALPAGAYRLKRRLEDRLRLGEATVGGGKLTYVYEAGFRDAPFSDDPVKGASVGTRVTLSLEGRYQSFFAQDLFPSAGMFGAQLDLLDYFKRDWIWSFDLAMGGGRRTLRAQGLPELGFAYSQVTGGTTVAKAWPFGRVAPYVGGRMALVLMSRTFDEPSLPRNVYMTFAPGLVTGVRIAVTHHWGIDLRGRLHYLVYAEDKDHSLGFWELAASVGYEL